MPVYTAPSTLPTGFFVTASVYNTDLVENIKYFKDAPVFDTAVIIGAATTSGIRLDLESGTLAVREGDDSAYAPLIASIVNLPSGGSVNFASGDVTLTHSTNTLTFGGAASGYIFNDGNVGIGVTPSAWLSTVTASQIKNRTAVYETSGGTTGFGNNVFLNSSGNFVYLVTGAAGLYDTASGEHRWYTAPSGTAGNTATLTERFRILSGGNVAIGATARLYLDGVTGTGDTYITETGANAMSLFVGGVEGLYMTTAAFYAIKVYDDTTANAVNVNVNTDGRMRRSTSSIRYKHDVVTLDSADALSAVMAMRPVTYRGKTDADQRRYVGFIAEEMQQWAPLLCTYDDGGESGTPNYVTYDRVTAYLVAVVQQQQTEINALKARIH